MGFLFNTHGYLQLDGYSWKTISKGFCDKERKEYRKICGYDGAEGRCVSKLTNHACKHFVNGSPREKEALVKSGLLDDHAEKVGNNGIKCFSSAKETEDRNNAIGVYKRISENSLENIDYAIASKGNVLLHGTGNYTGFKTVVDSDRKSVLSFYHDVDFSYENYCFYKLIKRLLWDEKYNAYNIPDVLPNWVDVSLISYEGNKWLNSCTNGCLGMSHRINSAFSERPIGINDVKSEIRNIVFHYHYNSRYHKEMELLHYSKKKGAVDNKKKALIEMLYANYALGKIGVEYLDIEERCYPNAYGLDTSLKDLFNQEDWREFDNYLSGDILANVRKNINRFISFVKTEEIGGPTTFIADAMAQSIAMEVFTLKLLKNYAGDPSFDYSEIDNDMESDPVLKGWNDFYTFWLSIDWNPGIEIIIDELQDYLEMTDCLDEVAKEDHDDCTHLRIDNVYVNTIKYHYDYELNAITGSANVSYTVIIRFYEGDEFNGGLMDSDENYDDCANISFEAVIGDDLTDVRINDAEAF